MYIYTAERRYGYKYICVFVYKPLPAYWWRVTFNVPRELKVVQKCSWLIIPPLDLMGEKDDDWIDDGDDDDDENGNTLWPLRALTPWSFTLRIIKERTGFSDSHCESQTIAVIAIFITSFAIHMSLEHRVLNYHCCNHHISTVLFPDMCPTSKELPSTPTPRPIVLGWLTIQLLRSTGRALSSTAGAGGHHHNHHHHHLLHHHYCCHRHVSVTDSPLQRPPVPFLEPLHCCQCSKGDFPLSLFTFQWIAISYDMYSSNTNNDV